MQRFFLAMVIGLSMLLSGAAQVAAGGWAVIELVEPMPVVTEGQAVTFDVRVLQHGVTPMVGVDVSLAATNRETLTTIMTDADEVVGEEGIYRFEVSFPVGGTWKWHVSIAQLPGLTAFPPLTVMGAIASPVAGTPMTATVTRISISDLGFTPAEIVIPAGAEVEWTNDGVLPHQIVSTNLDFDDSPILQPGESYRFTFAQSGTYDYFCGPHPQMQGAVRVV